MGEVEKFSNRMVERGVQHMHVDWGPDAANMTAEERAKVLNDVEDWLSVPANNIASQLEGRAFLLEDSAHCVLNQFNCKAMEYKKPTAIQEAKAKDDLRFAELLRRAAEYLKASVL